MSVWGFLQGSRTAQMLEAQVGSGDVAHSWLLVGPAGSGKRPAALAIAAAVNCPVAPDRGCGECSTCRRIIKGTYPDVHDIAPEGPLIPVDVVRDLVLPEAARSPFEGARKVFIIDEAERMNAAAQNALLKTLEEPQADTIFVLVSGREEELLETIRSRCRIVHLERVSEERIAELLVKYGAERDAARVAARLSEGDYERAKGLAFDEAVRERRGLWLSLMARLVSPTDAFAAAEEMLAQARAAVKARDAELKRELAALAETVGEGRGTAGVRNAATKRHKRELKRLEEDLIAEALSTLASFYRDVVVMRRDAPERATNVDRIDELERWAASPVPDASLLQAAHHCVDAAARLRRNANVPLTVEATLIALVRLVALPAGAPR